MFFSNLVVLCRSGLVNVVGGMFCRFLNYRGWGGFVGSWGV